MSKKIIGIDLGGTSIKFAILTLDGEVQEKWSIKTNILDEGSHIVDDMIESIAHRLKMLGLDASEFQGIGMGSPGVVDSLSIMMPTLLLWVNVGKELVKTNQMLFS